jgi:hypothetical protein
MTESTIFKSSRMRLDPTRVVEAEVIEVAPVRPALEVEKPIDLGELFKKAKMGTSGEGTGIAVSMLKRTTKPEVEVNIKTFNVEDIPESLSPIANFLLNRQSGNEHMTGLVNPGEIEENIKARILEKRKREILRAEVAKLKEEESKRKEIIKRGTKEWEEKNRVQRSLQAVIDRELRNDKFKKLTYDPRTLLLIPSEKSPLLLTYEEPVVKEKVVPRLDEIEDERVLDSVSVSNGETIYLKGEKEPMLLTHEKQEVKEKIIPKLDQIQDERNFGIVKKVAPGQVINIQSEKTPLLLTYDPKFKKKWLRARKIIY